MDVNSGNTYTDAYSKCNGVGLMGWVKNVIFCVSCSVLKHFIGKVCLMALEFWVRQKGAIWMVFHVR